MNGDANIECGSNVLIDGAHGTMTVVSGGTVDLHLDSSFNKASLKANEKIIIRTPPDQNEHTFLIKPNCKISVEGFDRFSQDATETGTLVTLSGQNTAGHPRKVAFVEFAGAIELDAPVVVIQAESWLQKQMNQKKRFPNKVTQSDSQYRFY